MLDVLTLVTAAEGLVDVFGTLDFTAMVDIAKGIIPVAVAAAIPIWSIKFGWNFLKSMVTGL